MLLQEYQEVALPLLTLALTLIKPKVIDLVHRETIKSVRDSLAEASLEVLEVMEQEDIQHTKLL